MWTNPSGFQRKDGWVQSKHVETEQKRSLLKKPTLEWKKFSVHDILDWPEFWDSFEAAFHDDEEMVEIRKFRALRGYLTGDAFDTIRRIRVTEDNYEIAISLTMEKYGIPDAIVDRHIASMMKLPTVKSNDTVGLQKFYEALQFHIQALEFFGRNSSRKKWSRMVAEDVACRPRRRLPSDVADDL